MSTSPIPLPARNVVWRRQPLIFLLAFTNGLFPKPGWRQRWLCSNWHVPRYSPSGGTSRSNYCVQLGLPVRSEKVEPYAIYTVRMFANGLTNLLSNRSPWHPTQNSSPTLITGRTVYQHANRTSCYRMGHDGVYMIVKVKRGLLIGFPIPICHCTERLVSQSEAHIVICRTLLD